MTRALALSGVFVFAAVLAAQTPPIPRPFPGATTPTTTTPSGKSAAPPPAAPAPPPQTPPTTDVLAGAPVFPGAEYVDSFDAGRGQRYYLYGTNATYTDVVAYYKQQMRAGGSELFKAPAMHRFDLGRFQEDTMAYPPSIVVKDYVWNNSPGYLHVVGAAEKRFATIIQIVPAPAR